MLISEKNINKVEELSLDLESVLVPFCDRAIKVVEAYENLIDIKKEEFYARINLEG
jgi:ribosomal 30S subunit maturation factor RimM